MSNQDPLNTAHQRAPGATSPLRLAAFALVALGCSDAATTTDASTTPDVTDANTTDVTDANTTDANTSDANTSDANTTDANTADANTADVTDANTADASGPITPAGRCAAVMESVRASGFGDRVTVRCDDRFAYVVSDTFPAHIKMDGITGTNDQVPVPAPGYSSPVTLAPTRAAAPISIDAALGVAVNGVPIYDYSSQGALDLAAYDPRFDTVLTGELDQCGGHSGRGDDYHYHASPSCMIAAMRNRGPAAILGWAFDGYPIYGNDNPDGSPITAGTLDVCNGQPDPVFGHRYHTSTMHPYIVQCLMGSFDAATGPRVMPLSRMGGGGGRPPGEKPPGGVTNLHFVEAADGSRTMTYDHMGRSYSISYRANATANCWDFTDTSYTTRGVTQRGTYCRAPR